mmetsp:Transcript_16907/g.30289  ORF Transcript_16907/g.30289 Transcript_16907/m.30289 type:complete len:682 (-) Transcript_16907:14-2059(-)
MASLDNLKLYEELHEHTFSNPIKFTEKEKVELTENFDRIMKDIFISLDNSCTVTVPITIKYSARSVIFPFNLKTTFIDLSRQAGQYYSLPSDSIHFINDNEEIMPTKASVSETLLPWGNITFRANQLVLTIVLTEAVNQILEVEDKIELQFIDDTVNDTTMLTERALVNPKQKERNDTSIPRARKIEYWVVIGIQIFLYTALLSLWCANKYDSNLLLSNAFTQGMHKLLTNEVLSAKYEYYIYEVGTEVFSKIRTLPDIATYLSYIQTIDYCVKNCIPFTRYGILPVTRLYTRRARFGEGPSEFYEDDVYLPWPHEDKEDYGRETKYSYSKMTPGVAIEGYEFWYSIEGFKANINTTNAGDVMATVNPLLLNNYLDKSTRVVFLSMNFFNPNIGMVMPVMLLFQVDAGGNVEASISYMMFTTVKYETKKIILESFTLLISIVLFINLLLEITFTRLEVKTYKRFKQFNEELIASLKVHVKLPLHKRMRKPTFDESVMFSVVGLVWLSQIIDLVWDKTIYENHVDITEDEYADWYYIGWAGQAMGNFSVISSIFITYGLIKYLRIFIPHLSLMSMVLRRAVAESLSFVRFAFIGFIGFLLYFYLLMGPYSVYFSEITYSLMSLMQLLVGRWRSPIDVTEFVSLWYLIIVLSLFAYVRTVVTILQIVKFQYDLKLVMHSNNNP